MQRISIGVLSGVLIFTACAQRVTITPMSISRSATAASSSTPTSTKTSIPTESPTASITPLPTIPTFTPTFDASTILTVTPAPKAECPKEDPSVIAKFATPNSDGPRGYIAPEALDYLNSGGTGSQLRDLGLAEIRDFNNDIVLVFYRLCGGFGDFCDGTPRRQETTVLAWNGQNYVVQQDYYVPAQDRFQVIQDGDTAASQNEYDKALGLYQEALSSDMLKSYSPEIGDNLRAQYETQYGTTPAPTPHPIAVAEYPKLAAHAYDRIILLHIVQEDESDAGTVNKTLQQKFGNDPYGSPYVEMTTAFWNAYQSTHKCTMAAPRPFNTRQGTLQF